MRVFVFVEFRHGGGRIDFHIIREKIPHNCSVSALNACESRSALYVELVAFSYRFVESSRGLPARYNFEYFLQS